MKWFFDLDNPVMRALTAAADLLLLTLLTLLCSLPVFTLGAALAALADGCIHLAREREGTSIVRDYFRAFRLNFKKGTLLGLLLLAAAALLLFDYLAALAYVPPLRLGIAAIAVLVLALAVYAFALLARYENSLGATLKNAAALAIGYAPRTAGILAVWLLLWLLGLMFIRYAAPVLLMFGLSLPGYVSAVILDPVFRELEK